MGPAVDVQWPPRATFRLATALLFAMAATVYWITAYPSITWWDSSQYSLAAGTLGVTGPPGSLLLTLLGWPVTKLPLGLTPAHALNLFAGLLAALTVLIVFLSGMRVLRYLRVDQSLPYSRSATMVGVAAGALVLAFGSTMWEHAVKFTPYVLTAVFTALILWTMLRWWEEAPQGRGILWLAVLGLLFGLDFSVHRTNALLLPSALIWILMRNPRTLVNWRSLVAGGGGLAAGLAVQLLLIPVAALTQSPLNSGVPGTWARFWSYVSLEQFGGGFLLRLYPRKADLWTVQFPDILRVLRENFLSLEGPLSVVGALAAVFGIVGLVFFFRRDRRFGIAFALLLCMQVVWTVLYFNIPADFFRTFDRHYLPVCVTFAVAVACGAGVAAQTIVARVRASPVLTTVGAAAIVALAPAALIAANWAGQNASRIWFTRDYAANVLEGLPPNAIYFTHGDNDTFPILYLQAVEGVRPDVSVINTSLLNAPWYVDLILRRNATVPLGSTTGAESARIAQEWTDTTQVVPVAGSAPDFGLPAGTQIPDDLTLQTVPRFGYVLPGDVVLLAIVKNNRWQRPITFASTPERSGLGWFGPYGRVDGLHWRIVPVALAPVNRDILHANLMQRYQFRGYADVAVRMDEVSRGMGYGYFKAFLALMDAELSLGTAGNCREVAQELAAELPLERLGAQPQGNISERCG